MSEPTLTLNPTLEHLNPTPNHVLGLLAFMHALARDPSAVDRPKVQTFLGEPL